MESLCDLLFELSNSDRSRILYLLNQEAMNVTGISRKLSLTTQESSRHISRLTDVGLTEKDTSGDYHLTYYGRIVLRQLEGLEFSSRYKDYFTSHTTKSLPQEFAARIGALENSRYVNDMGAANYLVEKVIQEAEEYIWSITDRIAPPSIFPRMKAAFDRNVTIRNIMELSNRVVLPSTTKWLDAQRSQEMLHALNQARISGLLQERVLAGSDVYIYMSEKEVAGVAFPFQDGRLDYLGFTSEDERARKWCGDIFKYYWERTEPRSEVVERLINWLEDKPRAVNALKDIVAGKDTLDEEESALALEDRGLARRGKLTILGLLVYRRLQ
jgi:predicted transcriptional regulator